MAENKPWLMASKEPGPSAPHLFRTEFSDTVNERGIDARRGLGQDRRAVCTLIVAWETVPENRLRRTGQTSNAQACEILNVI